MATVMVRGSATAPATPDEATVVVELAELRETAEEAYTQVAERSVVLAGVLEGIALERVAEPGLGPPESKPFTRMLAAHAAPVEIGVEPREVLVSAPVEVSNALEPA
jgi:hypothetical protein